MMGVQHMGRSAVDAIADAGIDGGWATVTTWFR
jgi:hypothetical protein